MKNVIFLLILMSPLSAFAELNENWKRDAAKAVEEVQAKYSIDITEAAWEYDVAPSVITAIIIIESLGDKNAVSSAGAKCLMQTKDFIGKEVGLPGNSCNPRESILRGTAYLARMRDHYGHSWLEAMAVAYKDGPTATRRYSDNKIFNHPYVEKMRFVLKHL
jgi:soluble lytic murein transglycosylase-like protein